MSAVQRSGSDFILVQCGYRSLENTGLLRKKMSQNKCLQMRNANGIGYITMRGLVYSNFCVIIISRNVYLRWLWLATVFLGGPIGPEWPQFFFKMALYRGKMEIMVARFCRNTKNKKLSHPQIVAKLLTIYMWNKVTLTTRRHRKSSKNIAGFWW